MSKTTQLEITATLSHAIFAYCCCYSMLFFFFLDPNVRKAVQQSVSSTPLVLLVGHLLLKSTWFGLRAGLMTCGLHWWLWRKDAVWEVKTCFLHLLAVLVLPNWWIPPRIRLIIFKKKSRVSTMRKSSFSNFLKLLKLIIFQHRWKEMNHTLDQDLQIGNVLLAAAKAWHIMNTKKSFLSLSYQEILYAVLPSYSGKKN